MIIASLVLLAGLAIGVVATRVKDLRLGGVVVVPLVALYTLYNANALPVFVFSTVAAYLGLRIFDRRLLLYGRRRLGASIVVGAAVPVLTLVFMQHGLGESMLVNEIEFSGSVLPGIAAYNLDRLSPEERRWDVLVGLVAFVCLVGLAAAGAFLWMTPPCTTCAFLPGSPAHYMPSFLTNPRSDIALVFGSGYGLAQPIMGTELSVLTVVIAGGALAEGVRKRWGLRPMGVVSLSLLALFSLRSRWTVALYMVAVIVAFAGIRWLHWRTFLYGRMLLSFAIAFAVLSGIPTAMALPFAPGIVAFFTVILAGVGAYNLHAQAPAERPRTAIVSLGVFVATFGLARAIITPLPTGLGATVTGAHVGIGLVVLLAAGWQVYDIEVALPSNRAIIEASVHSSMEEASR